MYISQYNGLYFLPESLQLMWKRIFFFWSLQNITNLFFGPEQDSEVKLYYEEMSGNLTFLNIIYYKYHIIIILYIIIELTFEMFENWIDVEN